MKYFETDHEQKGFEYPEQDKLLQMVQESFNTHATSAEGAYILLHLVRSFCRQNEDDAIESDDIIAQMQGAWYGWDVDAHIASVIRLQPKKSLETASPLPCSQ